MTTLAAEGLPRRRWTVAEIEELTRTGFFEEDDRFELIGGEIVPMNAKGIQHEVVKAALNRHWVRCLPDEFHLVPETTFRMSIDTFVEPDFVFYRKSDGLRKLSPKTALLAVEVADSSLPYDMGRKALLYAGFGIPHVWVINAVKLETTCFSLPGAEDYAEKRLIRSSAPLVLPFAPELAVTLGELELD
jgi:Uma2 family endonuclease